MNYHTEINDLLARLRNTPMAGELFVFGSVAHGHSNPQDLDVVWDLSHIYKHKINDNYEFFNEDELIPLIQILRTSPQASFDLFVKFKDTLLVRNPECTHLVRSLNAKNLWQEMKATMVPLSDIMDLNTLPKSSIKPI